MKKTTVFAMLSTLFALQTQAQVELPDNSPELSTLPQACQTFITQTLPKNGWKGGFVDVPEDWANPKTSRQIKVFYYYDASRDLKKSKPILFLNGGPFSSYQGRMEALHKKTQLFDVNKEHTFVMMDQRGVGCSVPSLPQPGQTVETFGLYATDGVVRDSEVIRKKLFPNRRWKIFAQSYGSFLAARYLDLFPHRVSSVHSYGPVIHENKKDFFKLRIIRQNEVLKKFFDYYKDLNLERALTKIKAESDKYCIDHTPRAPQLCGQVLLDGVIATIGQGKGRDENKTEVWDSIRDTLLAVINDDVEKVKKDASNSLAFFRNPSSIMVSAIWGQELLLIDGSNAAECDAAYAELSAEGVDVAALPLDECRIIKQAIPKEQEDQLRREYKPGKNVRTYKDTLQTLKEFRRIQFFMYTGELDSLAQPEALQGLIQSKRIKYEHITRSGHAGWLYEPNVWNNLIQAP